MFRTAKAQKWRTVQLTAGAFVSAFTCLVFFSSCNRLFQQDSAPHEPVQLQQSGLSCMNAFRSQMASFITNGTPSPSKPINCLIKTLDTFIAHTDGQTSGTWSEAELNAFLTKFFTAPNSREARTGPEWLKPLFSMKPDLLGGDPKRISKAEMLNARNFLTTLAPHLEALAPVMNTLLLRTPEPGNAQDAKALAADVERAATELRTVANTLARQLAKPSPESTPFVIETLPDVLQDFQISIGDLSRILPILQSGKTFLTGGSALLVQPREWPELVQSLAEVWIAGMRFKYELKSDPQIFNQNSGNLENLLNDFVLVIERSMKAQVAETGKNELPLAKWQGLLRSVDKAAMIPYGLREETIEGLLPIIFGKVLYGNSKSDQAQMSQAFAPAQLSVLKENLADWIAGMRLINGSFTARPGELMDADLIANQMAAIHIDGQDNVALRAQSQILDLLRNGRVLHTDDRNRLVIESRKKESKLNLRDLNKLNHVRAVAGLLIRGYAHDPASAIQTTGVTDVETQELYLDARELGRDLNLIDPRIMTAGSRTFIEAGIFTSVADGVLTLNVHKAVDWFHNAFEASSLARVLYNELRPICAVADLDLHGLPELGAACFRRELQARFADTLSNLPGFVNWYRAGGDARASEVEKSLEIGARGAGYTDQPVSEQELRTMFPILHYAEGIFASHDLNSDDVLDEEELWKAFPIIRPFIPRVIGMSSLPLILEKGVFSWLVVFGGPPTPGYIGDGKVLAWSIARNFTSEHADRLGILKIIASFTTMSSQQREKLVKAYLGDYKASHSSQLKDDLSASQPKIINELTQEFQCDPAATTHFGQVLKSHLQELIPDAEKLDPELFLEKTKALITNDSLLNSNCLIF